MSATTDQRQAARTFTNGVLNLDMSTLETALNAAYGEAYAAGLLVAAQQTGLPLPELGGAPTDAAGWTSFWDDWKPGNAPAADLLREGGLGDLLARTDTTIKGIEGTSLDYLGTILADGVAAGDSVGSIARKMEDMLGDSSRAYRIADTEMSRAVSAASMDGYAAAGIAKVEWLVSPGACQLCLSHAEGSPFLRLDAPTQPAHPVCRCSYSPVDPGTGQASGGELEGDVEDAAPALGGAAEYAPVSDVVGGEEGLASSESMDRAFDKWGSSLDANQESALTAYQAHSYKDLNAMLRNGEDASRFWSPSGEPIINGLDSAIASGSAPQDMLVYRGLGQSLADTLRVGDIITDSGYGSTTVSRDIAEMFSKGQMTGTSGYQADTLGGQILEIQVSKGTPMAWMDKGAKFAAEEGEALLSRGSRYLYTGVNPSTGSPILRLL